MSDMVKTMFAAHDRPWHGKGIVLGHCATSEEAIINAGLAWEVEKIQNRVYLEESGIFVENPYSWAIVRKDTGEVLGSVGAQYESLQNRKAFSHLDSIVGGLHAVYETAGVLYDAQGAGSRIWILAKLPESCVIARNDEIEKYLLLTHGHNGFIPVQMMFTPVQVVCNNTLSLATSAKMKSVELNDMDELGDMDQDVVDRVYMKHTKNLERNMGRAEHLLGITKRRMDDFEQAGNAMSSYMLDDSDALMYFLEIAGTKNEKACNKRIDEFQELLENKNQQMLPEARGSLWNAYSATTEWIDWYRPQRNPERNLESIWLGAAAQAKKNAYQLAVDMLTGETKQVSV